MKTLTSKKIKPFKREDTKTMKNLKYSYYLIVSFHGSLLFSYIIPFNKQKAYKFYYQAQKGKGLINPFPCLSPFFTINLTNMQIASQNHQDLH
jgi:hypothetical protein